MSKTPPHLRGVDARGQEVRISPNAERGEGRLNSPVLVVIAIAVACMISSLFLGPMVIVWVAPWAGAVLLAEFKYLGPRRLATEAIANALGAGSCPSCMYSLRELPRAADGSVVCAECGSSWRLPGSAQDTPTVL